MSEGAVQDQAYRQILSSQGIPLSNYKIQPVRVSLLPNAERYPQFFNQNLINDNRVIKQFLNNSHSNIRVFYFQLFRLGFESQTQNNVGREFAISFRRCVFYPQFEILFTHETQGQRDVYNDFQFKKLFAQFFQILSSTPNVNVQEMINTYPIIDDVMIHILRSILLNQGINQEFTTFIPTQTVFGQLSSIIGLSVTSYGTCWKFEDSDMFVYEQNQNSIYLAYIIDGPPATSISTVHEMVAVNYYEDPIENVIAAPTQTYTNQYNQNYQYQALNNQTKPQTIPSIATQSVYIQPSTSTYSPYDTSSYNYEQKTTSYTPTTTNTYDTYNIGNNYSSSYNSYDVNNYTSTNVTPLSYETQSYTSPIISSTNTYETSYAPITTTISQTKRSVHLQEDAPYGSGSGASQQRSNNPAKQSMISEYFDFEDFTGEVTVQKTKVPRSQLNSKLGAKQVVHYSQQNQINTMKFGDFGGISNPIAPTEVVSNSTTYNTYQSPTTDIYSTNYTSYTSATPVTTAPISDNSKYSTDFFLQQIKKYTNPQYKPTSYTNQTKTQDSSAYNGSYNYGSTDYKTSYDNYKSPYNNYSSTSYQTSSYKPLDTTNAAYGTTLTTNNQSNSTLPKNNTQPSNYGASYFASSTNYNYDNKYSTTTHSPLSSTDPYAAYSSASANKIPQNNYQSSYSSSYSSFTTPKDYNFYSSNPYVSSSFSSSLNPAPISTPAPQTYETQKNPTSTDYLSKYGISTTNIQSGNDYSYGKVQSSPFEPISVKTQIKNPQRVAASQYRPAYLNTHTTVYQQQKPSSSYEKYNYQSFSTPNDPYANYAVDYKSSFSNSGIFDIMNKVKPVVVKPLTANVYPQPVIVKPSTAFNSGSSGSFSASGVGGGYGTNTSYTFNYKF